MKTRCLSFAALAALLISSCAALLPVVAQARAVAPVRHVFVIVLENEPYQVAFGAQSLAPYLAHTLPAEGALLTHYYATGHDSLDNYIALVSGQAPNPDTQHDCQKYVPVLPGTQGPHGQALGTGCVYPAWVPSLPDQLEAAHLTWKGYFQDMGKDPAREAATCGHVPLGAKDWTERATPTDQYAAKHNPFVYFARIVDNPARCDAHVVNLDRLQHDLARIATTPNYNFIIPDLCDDGHDAPCANGQPGGLISANAWLRKWVPIITAAPAFKKNGLLLITFDEGTTGKSCCGEQPQPGGPQPGKFGPGGGRIGAVAISPFIKPGTVSNVPYNHYGFLRTVEDFFGLSHLGYAAGAQVKPFGRDVFTAPPR
jgi:hypothetical protein